MNKQNHHNEQQRVIAFLDRYGVDYLDRVGKNALFTSGYKLSRVKIIKAAVDILIKLGVSGKNAGSVEEFEKEILSKISRFMSYQGNEKQNVLEG